MGQVAYWRKLSRMTALRRKVGNQALCDLCGMVPAQERHHLIPKSSTNDAAREIADEDVLTCLLCRECHDNAHAPGVRERIFRNLYVINGRGDAGAGYALTLEAFTRLKELTRLTWELPEPGENGE
ncbi:MAG: hypothetical protein KA401_04205 [Anaerolineae bacterium]|nr:hypothetical protein [Chloroflexota bacterium]MBP6298527.1 hypothetical protein [Anaerolineae bacterium]